MTIRPGVNLGNYDLNKLLRNPADIHIIQDKLMALPGNDLLTLSISTGAKDDIDSCLNMIVSQYKDNPRLIIETVGKETLKLIEDYKSLTLADDLPNPLFTSYGMDSEEHLLPVTNLLHNPSNIKP